MAKYELLVGGSQTWFTGPSSDRASMGPRKVGDDFCRALYKSALEIIPDYCPDASQVIVDEVIQSSDMIGWSVGGTGADIHVRVKIPHIFETSNVGELYDELLARIARDFVAVQTSEWQKEEERLTARQEQTGGRKVAPNPIPADFPSFELDIETVSGIGTHWVGDRLMMHDASRKKSGKDRIQLSASHFMPVTVL